jgi:peptidylprolyl isomerase
MLTKMRITAIATLFTVSHLTGATQMNANQQKMQNAQSRQNMNQPQKQNANQPKPQASMPAAATPAKSTIDMGKLSEAFGNFIGRNLKTPGVNFDLDRIVKGMREGAAGKPSPMTDQEYEAAMAGLQEQVFNQLAQDNLKAANEFLAKNSKAKGVFEIEPGKLQYLILEEGKGPEVLADSKPLINYTGKYLDGTIFDSSENVGGPVTIPLNQTIPGFSRGLIGMKEGEKRRIFIHPDLGYGTQSPLPPNAMLIFDVEVVKANTPEKHEEESSK